MIHEASAFVAFVVADVVVAAVALGRTAVDDLKVAGAMPLGAMASKARP